MPVMLVTLTFVSPAFDGRGEGRGRGGRRTDGRHRPVLVVRRRVDADRWPTVKPLTLATLMFVSPAAAGPASVVAVLDAVPTDATVGYSSFGGRPTRY